MEINDIKNFFLFLFTRVRAFIFSQVCAAAIFKRNFHLPKWGANLIKMFHDLQHEDFKVTMKYKFFKAGDYMAEHLIEFVLTRVKKLK
jgi:hypothetical protein